MKRTPERSMCDSAVKIVFGKLPTWVFNDKRKDGRRLKYVMSSTKKQREQLEQLLQGNTKDVVQVSTNNKGKKRCDGYPYYRFDGMVIEFFHI